MGCPSGSHAKSWMKSNSEDGTWNGMSVPFVPAPLVGIGLVFGLVFGMAIGALIASKKQHMMTGGGMYGGMHGMPSKKWMKKGRMHHHHGYGTPPCDCGSTEWQGEWPEPPSGEGAPQESAE